MSMSPGFMKLSSLVTGKKTFRVPDFQRNYAWEEEHLEDLWRDLENVGRNHFYGTIILEESEEDGIYDIVDGQQRLTTAIIVLNELARKMQKENPERASEIRRWYVKGPGERFKLELMGDDGGLFKDYLGNEPTRSVDSVLSRLEPSSPSQKRLINAVRYFARCLDRRQEDISKGRGPFGNLEKYCTDLQERIESLDLMVYPLRSRTRAVQIFSITNDRGKGLTALEKTKSFLMEELFMHEKEEELEGNIDFVQRRFQKMYEWVDRINDEELSPSFEEDQIQRFHFILWDVEWTGAYEKRHYQRHLEELKRRFRDIEKAEKEAVPQRVIEYTKDLYRSFLVMYRLMLRKKENTKIDSEIEERLERLLAIGRLGNFYPLLIASYERYEDGEFGKEEFVKILERIETFIFRIYSVKQRPAHTARIPFYRLARSVHKKEVKGGLKVGGKPVVLSRTGADEILSEIEEQIHSRCDDETLRSILSRRDLFKYYGSARKSELRYLLYFYEKALEKEFEGLTPPLLPFVKNTWQNTPSGDEVTIEHISPQSDAQLNFTEEERKAHESYKDKLGNLAYMTGPWNKEQQDRPVAKKISAYRKSKIRMLNSVARIVEREGWGENQIREREEAMIGKILEIWPDPKSRT